MTKQSFRSFPWIDSNEEFYQCLIPGCGGIYSIKRQPVETPRHARERFGNVCPICGNEGKSIQLSTNEKGDPIPYVQNPNEPITRLEMKVMIDERIDYVLQDIARTRGRISALEEKFQAIEVILKSKLILRNNIYAERIEEFLNKGEWEDVATLIDAISTLNKPLFKNP